MTKHKKHHSGPGRGRHKKDQGHFHELFEGVPEGRDPQAEGGQEPSGFCPMCKHRCPLSAPACERGEAYVRSLNSEQDEDTPTEQEEGHGFALDLDSLFKQTVRIMSRYSHRHDQPHHAQRHVYRMIKEKGPLQQKELMDILGIRSASLSEVLGKLERRGYIARQRNEEDRRGFIVSVKEEMEMAEEDRLPGLQDMFSCLDEQESEQLAALLEKIISSADKGLCDGKGHSGKSGEKGGLGRHGHAGKGRGKRRGLKGEKPQK